MKTIYLASGNAHKLHELQTALDQAGLPVQVAGPDKIGGMPEVEETGSTFEANALLKAHGLQSIGPKDAWFLADDSGIEIDALDGRPGVISARYAGEPCDDEANNDKVIAEMKEVPEGDRGPAVFAVCSPSLGTGWKRPFPVPARAPFSSSEEGAEDLGMTHSFCPMRASLLLPKFPWKKRPGSATVPVPLPN